MVWYYVVEDAVRLLLLGLHRVLASCDCDLTDFHFDLVKVWHYRLGPSVLHTWQLGVLGSG